MGCSPWGQKESDMTEHLSVTACLFTVPDNLLELVFLCPHAAAAAKSLQSCPTLSDPMDCSPPDSSVHGIFQARVLEWGAIALGYSCANKPL